MTAIYHITHLDNLPAIIQRDGLLCDNARAAEGIACLGIAHVHIKQRRARKVVPVAPGGTLADFVPFYFAPRSPMLYAINGGWVEGYKSGQTPVVHLVSSAEAIAAAGLRFCFSDGHAEMDISDFYGDLAYLKEIDWEIMKATYWRDTNEDNDRKRRRQAEFLVHHALPWQFITEIGVISSKVGAAVAAVLATVAHKATVAVHRDWYY